MAIDARIPLGLTQQVQGPDQVGMLAKLMQLQGAQQGIRLNDLQYTKLERDMKDAEETKAAYAAYLRDPTGVSLATLGEKNPKLVQEILKAQRDKEKDEAEIALKRAQARKTNLEAAGERAQRAANILSSAKDQSSYELAKSALVQQFGAEAIADLPERYDPAALMPIIQEGMSLKDRIEAELKRERLTFDKDAKVVDQGIAQQNADSSRISARAAQTSAGAAVSNARTAAERLTIDQQRPFNTPLTGSELSYYVRPDGTRPSPGMSLRDVVQGGFQFQTTGEQSIASAAKGAQATVDRLEELTNKVWGEKGGGDGIFSRMARGASFNIDRMRQTNPDLNLYDSFSQGTLAPLIRSMGEKGNLSDGDIKRAIELVPKTGGGFGELPDTPEVARQKVQQLKAWFQAAVGKAAAREASPSEIEAELRRRGAKP